MTGSYIAIKDQLVIILQGVEGITAVYGKEAKALNDGGFPAVTIEAKGHSSNYYSLGPNGANERVYEHFVRIYFRTDEANNPDYEDVLESVIDGVITALEENITLNGACEYAIPLSGEWKDGQKESPVRLCELVISSTVHVSR